MRRITVFLTAIMLLVAGALAFSSSADAAGTINWTGNGTTNGVLNTQYCAPDPNANVPGQYLLWVLSGASDSSSATITISYIGGGVAESGAMTQRGGGAFQYISAYYDPTTITASATFSGSSASRLVISHGCPGGRVEDGALRITKTAVDNVCNGASVTYTYTIYNDSATYTFTGSLTDDVLGTIASGISIPQGSSATFTKAGTVTGTVTNTATVSGTFNDFFATGASASVSKTVVGHTCSVSIVKSVNTSDVCTGSTTPVTYSYLVTNLSDAFTATGSVTDDKLGSVGTFSLLPGASVTLTANANVTGTVSNTASASAALNDVAGSTASATSNTVTVTGHVCTISLVKTVDIANVCTGGATTVTYTFTITNNSDEFTWVGGITDDKLGTIDSSISLTPGETEIHTKTAVLHGSQTNIASASGAFNDAVATGATAQSDAVTVTGRDCTISITKSVNHEDVCTGSASPVTYTYVVKNTGNWFNASGSVTDDNGTADTGDDIVVGTFADLAPGAEQTITWNTSVSGTVTNIATANATFDDAGATPATATASATVTGHNCSISLEKTAGTADVCTGSTTPVEYSYVVTNTGDFFTASGTVTDDNGTPNDATDDVVVGTFTDLAPDGGSVTLHATVDVTGTVTNTATASGTFGDSAETPATATATATVTGHDCTIAITKTADAENVCNGTTVHYTIKVTNTGDFFNVSGTVTDSLLTIDGDNGFDLAPGDVATFTASGPVTGTVVNTATASGTFGDAIGTEASATATATVNGRTCTIDIQKSVDTGDVCTGSATTVTYTYVVTNTGDFFSASGSVSDDKLGAIGSFGPLAPGETETLTKTTTVNGSVTNVATASATFTDAAQTTATATATTTVTGHRCSISLTKTPSTANVCNGGPVTYTYVVTNTGDFFKTSGTVTDDNGTPANTADDVTVGTYTDLAPNGGSATLTATMNVTGTVTNTATASGPSGTATVSATATATVNGRICSISITKTASLSKFCGPNTSVTYTYVVKNTGNWFTASGTVTDDKISGTIGTFTSLAPGASQTFTKTVTITGTVTNTATASGTTGGKSVSATATATVTRTGVCPLTPGYWKNHATETTALLPISLGGFSVANMSTATAVFNGMNCGTSTDQGAIGCLAGHLLAAKLNVKNGAGSTCINSTIAAADAFLTSINYQGPTKTYVLSATQRAYAINLKTALDNYNNSIGC